jgi:7-cyano-7-deazaguanine synthase in queuosine biosynthesis
MKNSKVLHVYSGGLDSTVLLYQLLNDGNNVECVNFFYGSNHNSTERECAEEI